MTDGLERQGTLTGEQKGTQAVMCPLCGNEMTYIQVCHLRCNFCGSELSCEDKGWFWG